MDPSTRRLYLIQYYSKVVPDRDSLLPMCILELQALYLCLRKWRHYLQTSVPTVCFVDSRIVSFWCSMEIVSERVARWLIYVSEFAVEVRFVPSSMEQADLLSRLNKNDVEEQKNMEYNPLGRLKIYNSIK